MFCNIAAEVGGDRERVSALFTVETVQTVYRQLRQLRSIERFRGECQNPYNHNPYCVEILIGFVEILIGLLEILIGLLEILIGQFRDFDFDFFGSFGCRDLIFQ